MGKELLLVEWTNLVLAPLELWNLAEEWEVEGIASAKHDCVNVLQGLTIC